MNNPPLTTVSEFTQQELFDGETNVLTVLVFERVMERMASASCKHDLINMKITVDRPFLGDIYSCSNLSFPEELSKNNFDLDWANEILKDFGLEADIVKTDDVEFIITISELKAENV